MNTWKVKKGNTSIKNIPIYQRNGVTLVDNLASALTARFIIRDKATKLIKIEKAKGNGLEIDIPVLGWIRITLSPTNTNLPVKKYEMGLEFSWDAETRYEVLLMVDGKISSEFEVREGVVE